MAVREKLTSLAFDAVRALVWGTVIILVIVLATFIFGNATLKTQRVIGCELGVPAIDGVRSPVLLRACWTDEGLEPPRFFDE